MREMSGSSSAREVEIKLDIAPDDASKLDAIPLLSGEADHQRQISVYFDTPKGKLRRNGWVLRVREVDGCFTQTIKHSAAGPIPIERDEWEEVVGGLEPELKAISKTPLAETTSESPRSSASPSPASLATSATRTQ